MNTVVSARALSALYMYHTLSDWGQAIGGRTFVSIHVPSSFRLFNSPNQHHVYPCTLSVVSLYYRFYRIHSVHYSFTPHSPFFIHFFFVRFRHSLTCRIHIRDTGIPCTIISRAQRTPPLLVATGINCIAGQLGVIWE